MAHKLLESPEPVRFERKRKSKFKLPSFNGKFGFAFYVGGQEIFLGVTVIPVLLEEIVRKKTIPQTKGKVKFFTISSE